MGRQRDPLGSVQQRRMIIGEGLGEEQRRGVVGKEAGVRRFRWRRARPAQTG